MMSREKEVASLLPIQTDDGYRQGGSARREEFRVAIGSLVVSLLMAGLSQYLMLIPGE